MNATTSTASSIRSAMTDHRLLVFVEELQRHPIDLAAFLDGEVV